METAAKYQFHTAERLNGIGEYYFSQKLREIEQLNRTGDAVINLGIGSPDLPPHPDVIATLQRQASLPNVHAYQGYKGIPALREAISEWYAQWYKVVLNPDTEVLPLIGSKEGIMHVCMTYVNVGTLVLVPNPGYPTYSSAAKLAGGQIVHYDLKEENNWFPDFENLQQVVGKHPGQKLMFVNYPHMPTGQLPTDEVFQQLVAFARQHQVLICHDNPYSFILNENPKSLLAVEGARDVVLELNSLSKSHNMAGWRVGMLCGDANKVADVLRFKSNMDSGMFLPLQMAATTALGLQKNWFDQLNNVYNSRRKKVFELLNLLNCSYDDQQAGMFVWAKIPENYTDSYSLSDTILNECRVFVTPGGIFGSNGDRYIRPSLCNSETVFEQAIERLEKFYKRR